MSDPTPDDYLSPGTSPRGPAAGVTPAEMEAAARAIEAEGGYASVDAVYARLGRGRGTIFKYLKKRRLQQSHTVASAAPALSPLLVDAVKQLQALLTHEAEERIAQIRQASEEALDDAQVQLRATQDQRDTVEARKVQLQHELDETRVLLDIVRTERNEARELASTLSQQVADLKEALLDKDQQIEDQAHFINKQHDALTKASENLQHLLQEKAEALNAQRQSLQQAQAEEIAALHTAHAHTLQEHMAALKAVQEHLAETRVELALARAQSQTHADQALTTLAELRDARQRLETFAVDLALARMETSTANAKISGLTQTLAERSEQLDALMEDRDRLQAELSALQAAARSAPTPPSAGSD